MDPELKRQLEEIHALTKDNHHMLRAIRRHQWYSFMSTVVFWLVILVTPFYFYQQYVQPLVTQFSSTTGAPASGLFGLPTTAELQKLINSYSGK